MRYGRTHHVWYDVCWPVLAGLVSAVGLIAAYRTLGLLAVVAAFALVELTVAPTAWSITTEMGKPGGPAIFEIAPVCALAAVVLMGLVGAFGGWALLLVGLVAFTSPLVARRGRARLRARYGSEREETDRAFDEIVAYGWALPAPKDDTEL
jgi:hypothetical protein